MRVPTQVEPKSCELIYRVARRVLILCSKVYISFGGLLLSLEGPFKKLKSLKVDYVYMLIKK